MAVVINKIWEPKPEKKKAEGEEEGEEGEEEEGNEKNVLWLSHFLKDLVYRFVWNFAPKCYYYCRTYKVNVA